MAEPLPYIIYPGRCDQPVRCYQPHRFCVSFIRRLIDACDYSYDRARRRNTRKKWAISRIRCSRIIPASAATAPIFVSQCVYAGCCVMNYTDTFGWYYISRRTERRLDGVRFSITLSPRTAPTARSRGGKARTARARRRYTARQPRGRLVSHPARDRLREGRLSCLGAYQRRL